MADIQSTDVRHVTTFSGIMAAGLAADSEIYQFRWTNATQRAAVLAVVVSAAIDGTAFTAGSANFKVTKSSAWTVDGSGGNTATLTGTNAKLNTAISGQTVAGVRTASTAALGAGTKTLDTTDTGGLRFSAPGTVTHTVLLQNIVLFSDAVAGGTQLVLNQNEGFSIRATVPATGTWGFSVTVIYGVI